MADGGMLPMTGERFIPVPPPQRRFEFVEYGQNYYEHLHRYAVCTVLARGKDVLDIASGEGYGTAILASQARSAVGVDISQEAVEHARHNYYRRNLRFMVGDCVSIPLGDASVDLVTSFETLEHHDKHDEMMAEVKRVLRPGGTFVVSSPNKLTYSDQTGYSNPFHVRELYFDEFLALCERNFAHVAMYAQVMGAASFLLPMRDERCAQLVPFGSGEGQRGLKAPSSPLYFVAVCSDSALKKSSLDSLLLDVDDDFYGQLLQPHAGRGIVRIRDERAALAPRTGHAALPSRAASAEDLRHELAETMRALDTVMKQALALEAELSALRGGQPEAPAAWIVPVERPVKLGPRPGEESERYVARLEAELLEAEQRAEASEAERRAQHEQIVELQLQLDGEQRAATGAVQRSKRLAAATAILARACHGAESWHTIAELLSAELDATSAALVETRAHLAGILSSRSWRLTGVLRGAKRTLAPPRRSVR